MHMADALISPAVGGIFWGVSAGLMALSGRKMRHSFDSSLVPLMAVLGAFVFAAQMINFTIPATGSSGHLGGGMLLAILLGPYAAFMTIASVLSVQALFFADGGLLALGCNIFNLGFFPCFVAYPCIYKPLAGVNPTQKSLMTAGLVSAIVSLQLGAFGVVLETVSSGISALPFTTFSLLMQPVHLGIGIVEGLVTVAVVTFVYRARPEIMNLTSPAATGATSFSLTKIVTIFAMLAVFTGGVLSWFASTHPDGLEWSIAALSGQEELAAPQDGTHGALAAVQQKTALMPDYAFKASESAPPEPSAPEAAWPAVDAGTSTAGIVGGMLTLLLAALMGTLLRRRKVHMGKPAESALN